MPVVKQNEKMPEWAEVEYFEIFDLQPGEVVELLNRSKKEIIFFAEGYAGYKPGITDNPVDFQNVSEGTIIDSSEYRVVTIYPEDFLKIIRIGGFWNEELGTRGFFTLSSVESPLNEGDPAPYDKERNTVFDNHYHDFDEYWILYEGKGKAVSEGVTYEVSTNDCIATKMGHYHDFPVVYETIKGIWFETTLLGQKRLGHLWKKKLNKNEL